MARTSAQQPDTHRVEYDDKEGNTYSEVHGDADSNINVKTVAEKEGKLQPNLEGTTPDPFNPELTDWEKERRGLVEERTQAPQESSGDATESQEQKQVQQPAGNKMGRQAANK